MANLVLAQELRSKGIKVELELEERSFKAQMRGANRSGAALAVLRGENELNSHIAVVKDMSNGEQSEIPENGLAEYLIRNISK